ncbi:MAG: DUF1127 domain-containing protein [Pseudomonadota bacterium]
MSDFTSTLPLSYGRPSLFKNALHLVAVARSRRALSQLTDEALADVGLTREEASEEASRSIWDAPARWRR